MSQRIRAPRALAVLIFGLAVLVLLVSGVWMGARNLQDAMGSDRMRGTMQITGCSEVASCTGSFTRARGRAGAAPKTVRISKIAATKKGERLLVAVRPGTSEVVRTGAGGFFLAWVPLGGALLLSGLILVSGLGLKRPAAVFGLVGLVVLVGAWLAR